MLPSERLRMIISARIGIDLSMFAWDSKLQEKVFSIPPCQELENKVFSLKEVYEFGLNIGHCGLTSRYLMRNINGLELYYGNFYGLKGTKNSQNGNHAWVANDKFILDTTLMLLLPINVAKEIGYIFEKKIYHESAKILSEYELFSNEYQSFLENSELYYITLFQID